MDMQPYDLTPEQKGLLQSLSRKTGRDIPSLIAEALGKLRVDVHPDNGHGANSRDDERADMQPEESHKPIWEQFADAFKDVPEEELERLPTDLAAQVDHYAYGLPKRST